MRNTYSLKTNKKIKKLINFSGNLPIFEKWVLDFLKGGFYEKDRNEKFILQNK